MLHRDNRRFFRICVMLAGLSLVLGTVSLHSQDDRGRRGRKYKPPPPTANIQVLVLKADNGKPIQNAAVIFHPIEGDKDTGSMELKTNDDGKTSIDVIPIGDTVQLQVIANGFQTFGKNYKVDKDQMSMEVRLHRPVPEYSIYKDNNQAKNSGNTGSGNGGNSSGGQSSGDKQH